MAECTFFILIGHTSCITVLMSNVLGFRHWFNFQRRHYSESENFTQLGKHLRSQPQSAMASLDSAVLSGVITFVSPRSGNVYANHIISPYKIL
jgi:hypothetical protein